MIKVLGTKRVLGLVFLVALNVALATGVYLYAVPEKGKKERELRRLTGQIATLISDIERMQVEFEQLEAQQEEFDQLKARGFFGNQGRRQAEQILERIQKEAGVISAVAGIQSGVVEDNEEAKKAEHKILKSPVTIHLEAMDDVDVYRYIYLLEKFFPGHVTIESVNMERLADVSGPVLRSIASGSNPKLIKAEIEMIWRTMIPASEVIGTEGTKL